MRKIFMLVMFLMAPLASAQAEEIRYKFVDRPFLELLGFIEGPDGYDEITGFATSLPKKPISEMTINEVLSYQKKLRKEGAKSSAVGRFQFIYKTLDHITDKYEINRNLKFDRHMQDALARIEMARCGFYDPSVKVSELGNCLASTWAALPLMTGKNKGKSKYESMKINSVQTTVPIMNALLKTRYIAYLPKKQTLNSNGESFQITSDHFGIRREVISTKGVNY